MIRIFLVMLLIVAVARGSEAAAPVELDQVIREAGTSPLGIRVADFFKAYVDEAAIEQHSAAALKTSLEEIDRIDDRVALSRYLGAQLRADVDPLGVGIYDSAHVFGFDAVYRNGDAAYVPCLTQGGLGLRDREAYLEQTVEKQLVRRAYRHYVARMLASAGFDRASERAHAVLALEMAIARSHATAAESAKESNLDNYWTRADFDLEAPGLDWRAFFRAAGLAGRRDFVVWQPEALKAAASLVDSQPIAVWKDYLRFHLLHREADILPQRFASHANAFLGTTASRRDRAVEATSRLLAEDVGRLFVARYFAPERRARLQAIVDQWPDASTLVIDDHDPLANVRRIERWRYEVALSKLGRQLDRREWVIARHNLYLPPAVRVRMW